MKTITEFSGFQIAAASKKFEELKTAGKNPEEIAAEFGQAYKLEGDRLKFFMNSIEMSSGKQNLKRVVVLTYNEGEAVPSTAAAKDGQHYLCEFFYVPPAAGKGRRDGKFGKGRDDKRGGKKGKRGRGGRDGRPGREGGGDGRGPRLSERGPRPAEGQNAGAGGEKGKGPRRPPRGPRKPREGAPLALPVPKTGGAAAATPAASAPAVAADSKDNTPTSS